MLANSYQGKRLTGPNDVTSDARGRIYFTDARYFGDESIELPDAVYRIDPDGKITQLATDILAGKSEPRGRTRSCACRIRLVSWRQRESRFLL